MRQQPMEVADQVWYQDCFEYMWHGGSLSPGTVCDTIMG